MFIYPTATITGKQNVLLIHTVNYYTLFGEAVNQSYRCVSPFSLGILLLSGLKYYTSHYASQHLLTMLITCAWTATLAACKL